MGERAKRVPKPKPETLIIDGYNVIFAWDFLKSMAEVSLEGARETLMGVLDNYVAYTKADVTLVFDAYNVDASPGREESRNGYRVIYTAQNETADAYIERLMYALESKYTIRVVTSDRLIQLSAVHAGVLRLSAREFHDEILRVNAEITAFIRKLEAGK